MLDGHHSDVYIPPVTGRQLRTLRQALEITQQELADEIGVTRMCVTMWELGEGRPLTLRNFKAVNYAIAAIKARREQEAKTA